MQNTLISIPTENLPDLNQATNIKLVTDILDCMYNHDNVGEKRTNHNGWQSRYTHELSVSPEIMQIVDTKILDFVQLWISSHEPRILEMHLTSYGWFNVNFKNDLNVPHNHINPVSLNLNENTIQSTHTNPLFSGCYYIQVPDGEENSFYFTPEYETLHLWFKKDFREFIHTQTGDINLFYPNINHGVIPNNSDHPRITYSFNIHVHSNQP